MAKQKKKRTKRYHSEDSLAEISTQPVVHRYTAVDRGPVKQWWYEKRKPVTLGAKIVGGVGIVGWLLVEAIRIIF